MLPINSIHIKSEADHITHLNKQLSYDHITYSGDNYWYHEPKASSISGRIEHTVCA